MATKKSHIENYMRGEEFDRQPYLSEGISRRGFLKGLVGLTGATGATIFGKGILKQMEAWAQHGASVYIANFDVTGDLPQGLYQNVERQIPTTLETILRNKGIKVITRSDRITDDTIIIKGSFNYRYKDSQMRTGYQDLPFDSIELNIQYESNGSLLEGKRYKRDARKFPNPMIDEVGSDISLYLKMNSMGPPKESVSRNDVQAPDEIMVQINGHWKKARKYKGIIADDTWKAIERNDQGVIKSLQRDVGIIITEDKQAYKIIN